MSKKSIGKTITSITIGKKKVQVRFDDEVIKISPDTYLEFTLYKGKEISDKEYKEILKRDRLSDSYNYALGLVSKYTYSVSKLRTKLESKGYPKKDIDEVIKKLTQSGLLNDDEYIMNYLEYGSAHLYGENRIKEELRLRGIKEEDTANIKFDPKEERRKINELVKILDTKYQKDNYETRKRHIYSALLRYGYDTDLILEVIDNISPRDNKTELANLKKDYQKVSEKYKKKYKGYELIKKIKESLLRKGYKYNDIIKVIGE